MKTYILLFISVICIISQAHPHVFVDTYLDYETLSDKSLSIILKWEYDPMFSVALIGDYDKDGDMELNKEEALGIKNNIFTRMKDYKYYTEIYFDTTEVSFTPEFQASTKNSILIFQFFYKIPADKLKDVKHIDIRCIDEENYTAFKSAAIYRKIKNKKFEIIEGKWDEDIYKISLD